MTKKMDKFELAILSDVFAIVASKLLNSLVWWSIRVSKKQKNNKKWTASNGTDDTSELTTEQLKSNYTSNKELILQEMLNE